MRLMKNKIIGLIFGELILFAAIIGAQALAFSNGAAGGFYAFIDVISVMVVLGVGWGITLMQEHGIEKNQYGKTLYKNHVLGGWIGFMIGIILWLHGLAEMTENKSEIFSNSKTFLGLAYAIVPIFYGYIYAAITDAALTKTVKNEESVNDSFFGRILK